MNKKVKGFTLVELLAVIVILALLMVLAMPSIIKLADNAKKSTFQTALKKMINVAETTYQSEDIAGTAHSCYNATTLMPGVDAYKGCVVISTTGSTVGTVSAVWIYDDTYASFNSSTGAATKAQVLYKGWCDGKSATTTTFDCTSVTAGVNQMPILQIKDYSSSSFAVVVSSITANKCNSCG